MRIAIHAFDPPRMIHRRIATAHPRPAPLLGVGRRIRKRRASGREPAAATGVSSTTGAFLR
jgi:hypothetical protein